MAEVMKRFNGTDWGIVSAVNRIVAGTPYEKDYMVRFIDYDGTILKTVYCDTGESAKHRRQLLRTTAKYLTVGIIAPHSFQTLYMTLMLEQCIKRPTEKPNYTFQ